MDLGTDHRTDRELLRDLGAGVQVRETALVREWRDIVTWANRNIVTTPEHAATLVEGVIDTGVPIAGAGAPLVSEFNLMELIAVLGRTPDGGRGYVGRVIECAWRLPGVYGSVVEGRLAPWRAERIADLTRPLNAEAASFVDRQLAAVGSVGWAQIERLVSEAVMRFDPERAEAERIAASQDLYVGVRLDQVDAHGRVQLEGLLDAADGHDLDEAVTRRAVLRGKLGDDSSLDVRRAKAVGELARTDLSLDLLIEEDSAPVVEVRGAPATSLETTPRTDPGRKVVLNVHITDTALTGDNPVGRWDEARVPIAVAQIREWLQAPGTTITVRPVKDLADCVPVGSYEIPDRIRQRVELRDHACRFPHCTKPAARCDLDHVVPHNEGGLTCPCNLAPLCRRHHRAKTFSRWRYTATTPGTYLWTSPHGRRFRVDHTGTSALEEP